MKYLLALFLVFCAAITGSTKDSPGSIVWEWKLTDKLESEKPIRLALILTKGIESPSTNVSVSVELVGNLIYDGPTSFQIDLIQQPVCTTAFTVTVPREDTLALVFHLDFGKPTAVGNKVVSLPITFFHDDNGGLHSTTADFRTWSDEDKAFMKYGGSKYGDSALGIPTRYPQPPDFDKPRQLDSIGKTRTYFRSKLEHQNLKKQYLEEEPCVKDTEYIKVADTLFVRYRGEKKFSGLNRRSRSTPEQMKLLRERERQDEAKRDSAVSEILLDLRDSSAFRKATTIIGEEYLVATECDRVYKTTVTGAIQKKLSIEEILFILPKIDCGEFIRMIDDWISNNRLPPAAPDPKSNHKDSTLKSSTDGSSTILLEDYFDGFQWNWDSYDDDPLSGDDTWFNVLGEPDAYSTSAWCAGDGSQPWGGYYDNNQFSNMQTYYPVDLTNFTETRLAFDLWYVTESGNDWFRMLGSKDGYSWTQKMPTISGWWPAWTHYDIPIEGGTFWDILFQFNSNGSITKEGVFIDNVYVYGTSTLKPNLEPAPVAGSVYPIVVSQTMGSHNDEQVYGGEPAYINFAVTNNGQFAVEQNVIVNLYVDGVAVASYYRTGLEVGGVFEVFDHPVLLSAGSHNIYIRADPNNIVVESEEGDNDYFRYVYWDPPALDISGTVTFWNMNPPASGNNFAKEVRVELRDYDAPGVSQLLGSYTSNDYGTYSFFNINNAESGGGQQDIFIRVLAQNSATQVKDSADGPIIFYDTPIENNLLSGSYDLNAQIDPSGSGAFFIAQTVLEAKRKWTQARQSNDPGFVTCVNTTSDRTSYSDNLIDDFDTLYISKSNNSEGYYPDTYDRDIIEHEYGHHLTSQLHFFDESPGGDHSFAGIFPKVLTADEGFVTFFSCWLRNVPTYSDKYDNFVNARVRNLENGEFGTNQFTGSANNYGTVCEGAVAGIFWDIYDQGTATNDDYTRWNEVSGRGVQDGIEDSLSYSSGMANILTCLLDRTVNGHKPDDMDDFWKSWFQAPSNSHLRAMRDIYYEHGDTITCCAGIRGNVDYDDNDAVNIVDINYLSGYLFEGYILKCPAEADVNASGSINVVDATYLVNYLFKGGPPPPSCP